RRRDGRAAGGGPRHRRPALGSAAARRAGDRAGRRCGPAGGGDRAVNRKLAGPLVKLAVFAAVTALLTAMLAQALGSLSSGGTAYRARFADVTGLLPGDDVRIAGVRVGQV